MKCNTSKSELYLTSTETLSWRPGSRLTHNLCEIDVLAAVLLCILGLLVSDSRSSETKQCLHLQGLSSPGKCLTPEGWTVWALKVKALCFGYSISPILRQTRKPFNNIISCSKSSRISYARNDYCILSKYKIPLSLSNLLLEYRQIDVESATCMWWGIEKLPSIALRSNFPI